MQHGQDDAFGNRNPEEGGIGGSDDIDWATLWTSEWFSETPSNLATDGNWDQLFATLDQVAVEAATTDNPGELAFAQLSRQDSLYPPESDFNTTLYPNESAIDPATTTTNAGEPTRNQGYFDTWALTPYPSPRPEDEHEHAYAHQPVQPTQDVYHPTAAPGSDAHQQQWLRTKLRDSLRTSSFDTLFRQWSGSSSSSIPVKHPSLDEVAESQVPRKKKKP
jgi:hypothetical protein